MAIQYKSNALGATNSTTSFSITLPTTEAGDILILEYVHRGTADATLGGTSITTGGLTWTEKHDQQFATNTFSGKTVWTRATGNHSGQTITGSGLTNSCAAIVTVYSGAVATGDPISDATIVGEDNASGNETQAQITTNTNGAWVVLVVANSPDYDVSSQSCTSPGTLIERAERLSTGGTDTSISHASAEKATAGATGAFTWAQTDSVSGSWAYAIKPEPVPIDLVFSDLANNSTTDNVVLTQTHILTIQDASNSSTFDNVSLTQIHSLVFQDLANGSTIDGDLVLEQQTPSISLELSDLDNSSTIDNINLSQVHILQISDLSNQSISDNLQLTQIHSLQATDLSNENTIDSISITQVHSISIQDLQSNSEIENISISQNHILSITDLENNSTIDGDLVLVEGGIEIDLIIQDLSNSSTIDNIDLVQVIDLQIDSLQNETLIDSIQLSQVHSLQINDLENQSTIEAFTLFLLVINQVNQIYFNKSATFDCNILTGNSETIAFNKSMNKQIDFEKDSEIEITFNKTKIIQTIWEIQ